jgi:hypothetical protein
MSKNLCWRALLALLFTGALLAVQTPALAAEGRQATQLTLQVGDPEQGQHALARAQLTTAAGQPVANVVIHFLVNGQPDGQARTDPYGASVSRLLREDGTPGSGRRSDFPATELQ